MAANESADEQDHVVPPQEGTALMLYLAGENIDAGVSVVISNIDGKAYASGNIVDGFYLGDAVEQLREGFIIIERDGEVREDDA
jgi:hypothetical protein